MATAGLRPHSPHGDHRRRGRELEKAGRVAGVRQGRNATAELPTSAVSRAASPAARSRRARALAIWAPGTPSSAASRSELFPGSPIAGGEPAVQLLGQTVHGRARDLGGGIEGDQQLTSGWGGHGSQGSSFCLGLHPDKERKKRLSSLISSEKSGLDGRKPAPSRVGKGSRWAESGRKWAGNWQRHGLRRRARLVYTSHLGHYGR